MSQEASEKMMGDVPYDTRISIIKQASRDSSKSYCFAHKVLQMQSKYRDCERSCSTGCNGEGWCKTRQTLAESETPTRQLAQISLMERF